MKKLIFIVCSVSLLFSTTFFSSYSACEKDVPATYICCDEDELPFAHTAI